MGEKARDDLRTTTGHMLVGANREAGNERERSIEKTTDRMD